jgi:plasmid stabilization system protein ParE
LNLSNYKTRPAAKRDLEAHAKQLTAEAGDDLAMRFLDSSRVSFVALGNMPYMGARAGSRNPAFAELRKWRVAGFANYLIVYLLLHGGADILRVIHGTQNWWQCLDIDREP